MGAKVVDHSLVEALRARVCHRWHNALGRGWNSRSVEVRVGRPRGEDLGGVGGVGHPIETTLVVGDDSRSASGVFEASRLPLVLHERLDEVIELPSGV